MVGQFYYDSDHEKTLCVGQAEIDGHPVWLMRDCRGRASGYDNILRPYTVDGKALRGLLFIRREVTPYEDFRNDEKVLALKTDGVAVRGYFAGITDDGQPRIYAGGCTAWSGGGIVEIVADVKKIVDNLLDELDEDDDFDDFDDDDDC